MTSQSKIKRTGMTEIFFVQRLKVGFGALILLHTCRRTEKIFISVSVWYQQKNMQLPSY
jgi:hypothetical protein